MGEIFFEPLEVGWEFDYNNSLMHKKKNEHLTVFKDMTFVIVMQREIDARVSLSMVQMHICSRNAKLHYRGFPFQIHNLVNSE